MARFNLKRFVFLNKEGILIGGLVGFIFAKFFLPETFDFSMVQQTFGLMDVLKGAGTTTLEWAKTKVVWALTIFGAGFGLMIDNELKEGWWRKWLRVR